MTDREKANIIMEHLDMQVRVNNRELRNEIMKSIEDALEEIEKKEPTRTLKEVQNNVECIRAGIPVQVDYADPDDDNEYVYKQCW